MKLNKGLRPPHRGCDCRACREYHAKHGGFSINFKPYPAFGYRTLIRGFHSIRKAPNFFSLPDYDIMLGCSRAKVASIQHYLEAFGLIHHATLFETLFETQTCRHKENLTPTRFGQMLFDRDPYLESPDSLYLLHYHLATSPMALAYYYLFNWFIPERQFFSRNEATDSFEKWISERTAKPPVKNTIRSHINTVLRTYVEPDDMDVEDWADLFFVDLELIRRVRVDEEEGEKGTFWFDYDVEKEVLGLSTEVFGYALLSFWDTHFPHAKTLDLKTELFWAVGSPSSVFKLSENRFMEYLEGLQELTSGAIEHQHSTNLNQLYRTKPIEAFDFLK